MRQYVNNKTNLLVFSHLRWNFDFQRPQQLLTRLSGHYQIFFIEEPVPGESDGYSHSLANGVMIITPVLSGEWTKKRERMMRIMDMIVSDYGLTRYFSWYFTPKFLDETRHLKPELIIYDCMDELSTFIFAPPELIGLEKELFQRADIVFTGGLSLFNAKKNMHHNVYCFPSSIDYEHFAKARVKLAEPEAQRGVGHPRVGFFGVIDERFDIDLMLESAALMPNVHFIMVGPVVKIDPTSLPHADNIHYLGKRDYTELPEFIANWDIAMMPFALNESTRFISPTNTPEYLAAGKPVISTPITDVVHPYGAFKNVAIIHNPKEFKWAVEDFMDGRQDRDWEKVDSYLAGMSWQKTAQEMLQVINLAIQRANLVRRLDVRKVTKMARIGVQQ